MHFNVFRVNSQTPVKLRSTLSIGSSNILNIKKNNNSVQQSIGQTSVIGPYQAKNYLLLQGFIQPSVFIKSKNQNISQNQGKNLNLMNLQGMVYPNPFSESITISFSEEISGNINIEIDDLLGRTVYCNKYSATQELEIGLSNLTSGLYNIKIQTGNKHLIAKLIKK